MCGQSHDDYYAEELELNAKFRTFAVNSSLLYGGHNTVAAQLKFTAKHAANEGQPLRVTRSYRSYTDPSPIGHTCSLQVSSKEHNIHTGRAASKFLNNSDAVDLALTRPV